MISAAESHGLQIVPLIPCLSQAGHILSRRSFAHLREHEHDSTVFSVSDSRTMPLLEHLIHQTLVFSSTPTHKVSMVHVGMAGAGASLTRTACRSCVLMDVSENELLLGHVSKLARHLREVHNTQLMMWDDTIRTWPSSMVERLADEDVSIAVWNLSPDLTSPPVVLRHYIWNAYRAILPSTAIWGAAAYRGKIIYIYVSI